MAVTLLTMITRKRDAAFTEYRKWQSMLDTLTDDPDLSGVVRHGVTSKAEKARAMHVAHQNGNGAVAAEPAKKKRGRPKVTAKERRKIGARMKKYWATPAGKKVRAAMVARRRKGMSGPRKWTPEQRANYKATVQKRAEEKGATSATV